MSWSAGYVTDVDYTYGYYSELNPYYARFVLQDAGYALPAWHTACELGFGQGMSVNLHAASGSLQWYANDFNPQHAAFAQELAAISGSGAELSDESFAEFCARDDLPQFDFIGLHGIWSWISPDNRALIVDFVRRRLRVGGVLYISYNTLPGWAAFAPLRKLFACHAERMSAPGAGIEAQVKAALDFSQQLVATEPRALSDSRVKDRLGTIAKQDPHYLAHEYFNRDWEPMYFADLAAALAPAKLSYACQASTMDQVPVLHFTPEQQALLDGIADPLFRETVRDYIQNQQFRRDYWIKGARKLAPAEQQAQWERMRVALAVPRDQVKMKLALPRGTINLTPALYDPLLEILQDGQPRTLGELAKRLLGPAMQRSQLVEVIRVMVGARMLHPLPEQAAADGQAAARLNQRIVQLAQHSAGIAALASPQTGGGVPISRFTQLFIQQYLAGEREADGLARYVHTLLQRNRERVVHEGKMMENDAAQLAHLQGLAQRFLQAELASLQALGIVSLA
ncbi:MAG: class I SAM-dependent methyltransferase [Vogesella sp.]|nr:class I SAM-dependent methyltransferase [Vogesella sp.]